MSVPAISVWEDVRNEPPPGVSCQVDVLSKTPRQLFGAIHGEHGNSDPIRAQERARQPCAMYFSMIFPWPKRCAMLSVLSSSAINLTEELHRTRQDLILARYEASNLAEQLERRRGQVLQHLNSCWSSWKDRFLLGNQ